MYDSREEMMIKMVDELRKEQNHFEVLTDEEYFNSDYGIRRRQRNQTCSNVVYMHCLVPGVEKNLFGVYFHKRDIAIATPMLFEAFETGISVERTVKYTYERPFLEFRVIRKHSEELYEDTKLLVLELMKYAYENHLYHV